ncbi:MAG: hypothetical protein GX442_15905 [Candidatus Riflebacteria bacterium]|nr:hypothetical protein [Candidatus Riflebacteria bacterium]
MRKRKEGTEKRKRRRGEMREWASGRQEPNNIPATGKSQGKNAEEGRKFPGTGRGETVARGERGVRERTGIRLQAKAMEEMAKKERKRTRNGDGKGRNGRRGERQSEDEQDSRGWQKQRRRTGSGR